MLLTLIIYFAVLFIISRLTSRRAGNEAFFRGNRKSPWPMVAFGMIAIDFTTRQFTGYQFGYELLMLNGALTFAGLWLLKPRMNSLYKK
jgi:Na+/proline symporter